MSKPHDDYKRLDIPADSFVEPCPVCASNGELWEYITSSGDAKKVVMCANGEAFGPQDGMVNEGCLLYMPPSGFYSPRKAGAIKYWNDYAKALNKQRRKRNWERHNNGFFRSGHLTDCDMK